MNNVEIYEKIKEAIEIQNKIKEKTNTDCLTIYQHVIPITKDTVWRLHKVLRRKSSKTEKKENLSLVIHSGGGDIDAAAKIANMLLNRYKKITAYVPFYAKSAATYLALRGHELRLCKDGELGTIDPQVLHPILGVWIAAHSINDALEFIEKTKDDLIKLSMADKLDPFIIGAFEDINKASEEYISETILDRLKEEDKSKAVELFRMGYRSHGYPIGIERCKDVGLNVEIEDEELEELLYDLEEVYMNILFKYKNGGEIIQMDTNLKMG